ncbi:MAG TPA: hypothetical protein VGH90_12440 [Chthoniobacteraceae bacterium]|jgi:hypothetical protein
MKKQNIDVPAAFQRKCRRVRLPANQLALFALEAIAETEFFDELAKNFKILVAPVARR